jgi:hypothetical protein
VSDAEWARAAELGRALIEAGGVALYVPLRRMSELERLAGVVAEAESTYGQAGLSRLLVVLAAPPRQASRLRRRLEESGGVGLQASAVVVEPGVPVPAVSAAGEPVIQATGRLRLSAPGGAESLCRILRPSHGLYRSVRERKVLAVVLSSMVALPQPAELGLHMLRKPVLSVWHGGEPQAPQTVIGDPESMARAAESIPWQAQAVARKKLTGTTPGDDIRYGEIVEFRKRATDLARTGMAFRRVSDLPIGSDVGGDGGS